MALSRPRSTLWNMVEESGWGWNIPNFFESAEDVPVIVGPSFDFVNCLWELSLHRRGSWIRDYVFELHITLLDGNDRSSVEVECTSGLKKVDGSRKLLYNGMHTFTNCEDNIENPSAMIGLIKVKDLWEKRAELAPSDLITITWNLKRDTRDHPVLLGTDIPRNNSIEEDSFPFMEDCLNVRAQQEFSDVTFKVMDEEFKAHKCILACRSSVFRAMLTERPTSIINVTDCEPDTFNQFLDFVYAGLIEDLTPRSAAKLFVPANKYAFPKLKTILIDFLIEYLHVENVCDALILADKYDEKELFSAVLHFFMRNREQILESCEWKEFCQSNCLLANKLLVQAK